MVNQITGLLFYPVCYFLVVFFRWLVCLIKWKCRKSQ